MNNNINNNTNNVNGGVRNINTNPNNNGVVGTSAPTTTPTTALPEVGKVETPKIVADPTKISAFSPSPVNNPTAEASTVNASTISTSGNSPRIDGTTVVNKVEEKPVNNGNKNAFDEKMKQAEENYKPPSKFRSFMLIVFFILLILFIVFLPEVSDFMNGLFTKNKDENVESIPTGRLVCTLKTNTTNLDKNYKRIFKYTDNKLDSINFETTTKGDVSEDEDELNKLNNSCKTLKDGVSSLDGVSVDCDYSEGKLVQSEDIDLKIYDSKSTKAAYTEAGMDLPQYKYGDNIDNIKTSMLQGGFTCKKEG